MAKKATTDGISPKLGYRVLSKGYGSICDPDRDGDQDDYGSSYDYNTDGRRIYRPDKD